MIRLLTDLLGVSNAYSEGWRPSAAQNAFQGEQTWKPVPPRPKPLTGTYDNGPSSPSPVPIAPPAHAESNAASGAP